MRSQYEKSKQREQLMDQGKEKVRFEGGEGRQCNLREIHGT